jgi:hypothetical protein
VGAKSLKSHPQHPRMLIEHGGCEAMAVRHCQHNLASPSIEQRDRVPYMHASLIAATI